MAARPPRQQAFLRPLIFWRYAMYTIDRLIAAGVDPERAFDIVYCFLEQDNVSELERYICEMERGQRQRPQDG